MEELVISCIMDYKINLTVFKKRITFFNKENKKKKKYDINKRELFDKGQLSIIKSYFSIRFLEFKVIIV